MYREHDEKECKSCNCPEHGKPNGGAGEITLLFVIIVVVVLLYWR
jgi:hypothetical protein